MVIGMILLALLVAVVVSQRKPLEQVEDLAAKDAQIRDLQSEVTDLSNRLAQASSPLVDTQSSELLKLRGEIGVLKRQLAECAPVIKVQMPEGQPRALTGAEERFMAGMARQQYLTRMKVNHARQWMLAFLMYAGDNDGKLPASFAEAAPFCQPKEGEDNTLLLATNAFTVIPRDRLEGLNPSQTVVLVGAPELNAPGDTSSGWTKVYGFADGHVETVRRADGNFDQWETDHGIGSDR